LIVLMTACGPRDAMIASSAEATSGVSQHPLVGTWKSQDSSQEMVILSNGSSISEQCGSQGIVGDVEVEPQTNCGANSKLCGSFPYIVANSTVHPSCIEAGSYICYFNVYTTYNSDYLALNCTDGKGVSYFKRKL
jgi:hypothetical protein